MVNRGPLVVRRVLIGGPQKNQKHVYIINQGFRGMFVLVLPCVFAKILRFLIHIPNNVSLPTFCEYINIARLGYVLIHLFIYFALASCKKRLLPPVRGLKKSSHCSALMTFVSCRRERVNQITLLWRFNWSRQKQVLFKWIIFILQNISMSAECLLSLSLQVCWA